MAFEDEPPTRPGIRHLDEERARRRGSNGELEDGDDLHTMLGKVMRVAVEAKNVARTTATEVSTLTSEVAAMRRDVDLDRHALVRGASRHSSNRAALLMSLLWGAWQLAEPYAAALWRLVRK